MARDWTDETEHDPGVTLIELLAYAADLLSHYQERIAAEARLKTWRRYAIALGALALFIFCRRRRLSQNGR